MFTDKEVKLLAMALDKSVTEGEWKNAITLFGKSLRDRDISLEHMNGKPKQQQRPFTQSAKPNKPTNWGTTEMPFGKYKGETLQDCDLNYLHWVLGWMSEDRQREQKFAWLIMAIENYLKE